VTSAALAIGPWAGRPAHGQMGRRLRLFCFPYAGGSAADFRDWPAHMPQGVDVLAVQIPGRAGRSSEPPFDRLEPLVTSLIDELQPLLTRPYAFFGHSMGALLAFELARRMDLGPQALYVSGHRAPQLANRDAALSKLPDGAFLRAVGRLNGMPAEVLNDAELLELLLPRLRADFAAAETYRYRADPRLRCPVHAWGGLADRTVTEAEIRAWAKVTDGPFRYRMVPGDHFFLRGPSRDVVLSVLAAALQRELADRPSSADR
jgi:medium-chain acyl-[acyl-carrier-protein] hydrolase